MKAESLIINQQPIMLLHSTLTYTLFSEAVFMASKRLLCVNGGGMQVL